MAPLAVSAEIIVEQLDTVQPRSFGYRIGDKFERSIQLRLRKPYQLKIRSLPAPGRLTYWLTMEQPHIVQQNLANATQYQIALTYQIVNIDPDVLSISVPHVDLIYSDGNESGKALVRASRLSVAMLSDNKNIKLRPSQAPLLLPQSIFKVALFGLLLLGSLLGLAYLYWGLALLRKLKPFAEVHRRLKKTHSRSWDDKSYREALQSIHQAFNETAQKTVFAERLDEFFREHNKYQPLQQPITTYFTHSRKYFFDPVKDNHRFEYSRSDLMNLVEACRDIERGLA